MARITPTRKAAIAARRNDVWLYRVRGFSVSTIAARLGVSESTINKDLSIAAQEHAVESKEAVDRYRSIQLSRYELQMAAWLPLCIKNRTYKDENGDDQTEPPDYRAADITLRIGERIEKLLGLQVNPPQTVNHPEPIDVNVNVVNTGALGQLQDDDREASIAALSKLPETIPVTPE